MNFRIAKMDDLPQLKVVYENIIEEMNCNNIEIWNEIIDDNLTLHEYGFERQVLTCKYDLGDEEKCQMIISVSMLVEYIRFKIILKITIGGICLPKSCLMQLVFQNIILTIFKSVLHESLSHYVNRIRMEYALFMLAHREDRNITDIAYDLGFTDSAIFSRAFKNYYGISP